MSGPLSSGAPSSSAPASTGLGCGLLGLEPCVPTNTLSTTTFTTGVQSSVAPPSSSAPPISEAASSTQVALSKSLTLSSSSAALPSSSARKIGEAPADVLLPPISLLSLPSSTRISSTSTLFSTSSFESSITPTVTSNEGLLTITSRVYVGSPTSVPTTVQTTTSSAQPHGWTIALIVLAVTAILSSFGACICVRVVQRRNARRASGLFKDPEEKSIEISSTVLLPGSPRSPSPSSLTATFSSVYSTTSSLGSWTQLPLLTPTSTSRRDSRHRQTPAHGAMHEAPPSSSTSPSKHVASKGTRVVTPTSKRTSSKTFDTSATAGSQTPPVPGRSEIPLPIPPVPKQPTRLTTGDDIRTLKRDLSELAKSSLLPPGINTPKLPMPRSGAPIVAESTRVPRASMSSRHNRANTDTSSKTFATVATQGSRSTPTASQPMHLSDLMPCDPFAANRSISIRATPLSVSAFPHWPPTPPMPNWPVSALPPLSPLPLPPPPVPPIPQREDSAR